MESKCRREAKGILAILKSTSGGQINIPTNITETITNYLKKFKANSIIAAEKADLMIADKQMAYENYFNRHSSCRNFSGGGRVVLLIPCSTNKLYARCTGPDEVEQCSQHSYKVKLISGCFHHKMRKFYPRA